VVSVTDPYGRILSLHEDQPDKRILMGTTPPLRGNDKTAHDHYAVYIPQLEGTRVSCLSYYDVKVNASLVLS
jgi:hypothetical protein